MGRRACDSCYKKKSTFELISLQHQVQCFVTDPEPRCHWCAQHDVACTFNRVRGRRKDRSSSRSSRSKSRTSSAGRGPNGSVVDRLNQLESAIARLVARADRKTSPSQESLLPMTPSSNGTSGESSVNTDAPVSQDPVKRDLDTICGPAQPSYGQFHFAGHYIGYLSCDGGLPFFTEQGLEWIFSRTGGAASCARLAQLGAEHRRPPQTLTYDLPVIDRQGCFTFANALPDRSVTEKLLREFKGSVFGLVFPVIDEQLFITTVDLAYQPNDGQITAERIASSACVLAFLSVSFFFRSESADDVHIDTALCAAIARRFLPGLQKNATITGLQTVLLLHFHQMLCGNINPASKLLVVACRMTLSMGGHVNLPARPAAENPSPGERETGLLRTLFWLCYVLDKDVALRTGLPPIFPDEFCNMTLPDGYENLHAGCQYGVSPDTRYLALQETQMPTFTGDIRLGTLKGKISRSLYSMLASRKNEAELLRNIRELDEELEDWRMSLPVQCRPALSIPQEFQLASSWKMDENVRHILLNLEYHHLITAIHRVSARCPLGPDNHDVGGNGGIHSSLTLSIEASRSTLVYFKAAMIELANEALWLIIFYPISALLTTFFNILANPLDLRTAADIELLTSTTKLIKAMPRQRLAQYGNQRIDSMVAFLDELVHLGNSAIIYQMNRGRGLP